MTKETFTYILEHVRDDITKVDLVGDTIKPATRLAICFARLMRGSYYYDISSNYGVGETTAQNIMNETVRAIVNCLFVRHVQSRLPKSAEELTRLQGLMDFPFGFAAVDGCHIRIKCPPGPHASKDYHNFKNFYSIVLMALVDGRGRFLWAASGMPGNCHDSTLLQSTELWLRLRGMCELSVGNVGGVEVPALVLGDNAFPFRTFLMKRFTNANKTASQRKFNKALSHDRTIVENAFGYLKLRFRELFRGSECNPINVKYSSLAAVTIHNILFDREGEPTQGPDVNGLDLLERGATRDNNPAASRVRDALVPLCQ